MSAPFKMKGYTYPGTSPVKDIDDTQRFPGKKPTKIPSIGAQELPVEDLGLDETLTGAEQPVDDTGGDLVSQAGVEAAGKLATMAIAEAVAPKPKPDLRGVERSGFNKMTFGKDRRGKGSATELT